MNEFLLTLLSAGAICSFSLQAKELVQKSADSAFASYDLWKAPPTGKLLLEKNDVLAICGDSITEQRMYSVMMEAYLMACTPELNISCRQFGWSGEKAEGFHARMRNDVLRFRITKATTCYGMNDHRYLPYSEEIGKSYRENETKMVQIFKEVGVRPVVGSSGIIGKMPHWVKEAKGTKDDLNLSLSKLRNIGLEVAEAEEVYFADLFWPMFQASVKAQAKYGPEFCVYGKDGVHPGWTGSVLMAHAFLDALGLQGDIGTISYDAQTGEATVTDGHTVLSSQVGTVELESTRWPFCGRDGDVSKDDNVRSGMELSGFDQRFNRYILKVSNAPAAGAKVTWGQQSKTFTAQQLSGGINLAAEFYDNPFTPHFGKLWDKVRDKQEYETRQIKQLFHGPEGLVDLEATAALTEKVHDQKVAAMKHAFYPVKQKLQIEALP